MSQFQCPITKKYFFHAVTADDGITYEKEALLFRARNRLDGNAMIKKIDAFPNKPSIFYQLMDRYIETEQVSPNAIYMPSSTYFFNLLESESTGSNIIWLKSRYSVYQLMEYVHRALISSKDLCQIIVADVDDLDYNHMLSIGKTVLMYMVDCIGFSVDIAQIIMQNPNIDLHQLDEMGNNLLMLAIRAYKTDLADYLLNKNIFNLDHQNIHGLNVLMCAVMTKNLYLVQKLLDKKVNLSLRDKRKNNALLLACDRSEKAAIIILNANTTNISDINVVNELGITPIIAACIHQRTDLAKRLLAFPECDVTRTDYQNRNALIHACYKNMEQVALQILNQATKSDCFNSDHTDKFGKTALDYATENQMHNILSELHPISHKYLSGS